MRAIIVVLFSLFVAPALAAPGCHVDNYRFVFGQDSSITMAAKSGTPCTSHINDLAGITESVIAQQPANGSAVVPDKHHWGYKARAGYTGSDTFAVAVTGSSNGRHGSVVSGTTHLLVNVSVTQ